MASSIQGPVGVVATDSQWWVDPIVGLASCTRRTAGECSSGSHGDRWLWRGVGLRVADLSDCRHPPSRNAPAWTSGIDGSVPDYESGEGVDRFVWDTLMQGDPHWDLHDSILNVTQQSAEEAEQHPIRGQCR